MLSGKKVLRYEALGEVTQRIAPDTLAQNSRSIVARRLVDHTNVDTTLNVYPQCSTDRSAKPSTRSAAN
jgi:hypothetical protein